MSAWKGYSNVSRGGRVVQIKLSNNESYLDKHVRGAFREISLGKGGIQINFLPDKLL